MVKLVLPKTTGPNGMILIGLCIFGYGIVNWGLPSSADDKFSVQIMESERLMDEAMDQETDPVMREQLRKRANELSFEADMALMSSRDKESKHAIIAFVGSGISIAGFIVLILHRRRTRNLL